MIGIAQCAGRTLSGCLCIWHIHRPQAAARPENNPGFLFSTFPKKFDKFLILVYNSTWCQFNGGRYDPKYLNIPSLVTDVKKAQQVFNNHPRAAALTHKVFSLVRQTPDGYVFVGVMQPIFASRKRTRTHEVLGYIFPGKCSAPSNAGTQKSGPWITHQSVPCGVRWNMLARRD